MAVKSRQAMVTSKPRWVAACEPLAFAAVFLLAAVLRWDRLSTRNLWADEAFSLDLARKTLPELLAALTGEPHPFGYYALLSVWIRLFGEDLAWMRALTAVFGLAAVVITWRLGRRLFSPAVGIAAAALVALNPFQIFASNELRMYMLVEVLALGSTWLLWRAQASSNGYAWWVSYGASLALMAYVSYYALLLIPAHALWIALHRPTRQTVTQVGAAFVTALVLYAPWMPHLGALAAFLRGNPVLELRGQAIWPTYLPELVASQTFGGYVFNMLSYHTMRSLELKYHGMLVLPFVALAVAGGFVLGGMNRPVRNLLVLSWVVPVGLVVLASLVAGNVAAYPYHLTFLQPFLALLVAAGVIHLREAVAKAPASSVALGASVIVLAFLVPAIENLQWNPDYQHYRYDSAARLVKNLYQGGDVVVYFPRGVSKGFSFYFDPPGKELGVSPDRGRFTRESVQASIRDAAQALIPADRRLWLIYSEPVPTGSLDDLRSAIEQQGYRLAIAHDFKGLGVGLFVRPVR